MVYGASSFSGRSSPTSSATPPFQSFFSGFLPSLLSRFFWKDYLDIKIFFASNLSLARDRRSLRLVQGSAVRCNIRLFPSHITVVSELLDHLP